jgi:hypothetical protein
MIYTDAGNEIKLNESNENYINNNSLCEAAETQEIAG